MRMPAPELPADGFCTLLMHIGRADRGDQTVTPRRRGVGVPRRSSYRALHPAAGACATVTVPWRDAFAVWFKVAIHSFGGPAGQISFMHKILVEERRWISEKRFLHSLNYCMLLPGPEAMQLATYVGWLMHGVRGGLLAGGLFVLPGFIAILGLSIAYALWQSTGIVPALFLGLKAAVLIIVIEAVIKIGRRALKRRALWWFAAAAFALIFFLDVPFPLIIVAAGATGYALGRRWPLPPEKAVASAADAPIIPDEALPRERPHAGATARTVAIWLLIWWLPVVGLVLAVGIGHTLVDEAWFFSKTAVVTFGGAYAVLAYIAQRAVEDFAWLQPGEMLDGLGMAETTPGPLIQVVQFVGFMGAYRHPMGMDPLLAGIVASVVVTWVTFVPCFLWIFAGAPYVEALRRHSGWNHALTGITAAVVGVIVNLGLWFSIHVLFPGSRDIEVAWFSFTWPEWALLDWRPLLIATLAGVALLRLKWPMLPVLGAAAATGWLLHAL